MAGVLPPSFADILAARQRLLGEAVLTPLIESEAINALTGGRVLIKPECLQRTGSFKFRGAWNLISQLDERRRAGGVVAYSSGNHAQGVAAAARLRGFPALIVMPSDTPEIKQANTRGLGAEIVTYDRATESREEIARKIAAERGAVLVPPFEHADIVAGQGTVGLELAEQAQAKGVKLDAVVVNASGGGLTAGVALALSELSPETEIYCAEPEGFDDHRRSLASGRRERNAKASGSICDALLSPEPGEMTFSVNRRLLKGGLVASEAEVKAAMRLAFETLKLVAEPGGAVALAAVLSGRLPTEGRNVGVVISGGNVDRRLFGEILSEA
jgi:threonine dehydratase